MKSLTTSITKWKIGFSAPIYASKFVPWNRFSSEHDEPEFLPNPELLTMTKEAWQDLTEPVFDKLFEGSAVKRTKFAGLKRNIIFLDLN